MSVLAALFGSLVLSSSDICANPIPGGVDEPSFCVFSEVTLIQTPYFSFEAQPQVMVGLDQDGARVVVEGSIRQSPVGLRIVAHPKKQRDTLLRRFGVCGELTAESDSVLVCDESTEDFVRISRLIFGTERLVLAELSAGRTAFPQLSTYKKMLESLAVKSVCEIGAGHRLSAGHRLI